MLAFILIINFVALLPTKCDALREDKFVSNTTDYCLCKSSCEEYTFSSDEYAKYDTVLSEELKTNVLFRSGWEKGKIYNKSHASLSENEVLAVVTYTLNYPKVYDIFNFQTRTLGIKDDTYFFKGMHFFLSSVVHKLAVNFPQSTFRCETSSHTLTVGGIFSFKQFASTTADYYAALQFGKFCLHVMTLRGADISSLSVFPSEREVLIPSCETFQVVPVEKDSPFYARLRSTGGIGDTGGINGDEFREERFVSNSTDYCVCKSSCEEYSFSAEEYAKYDTILNEELKINGLLRSGWEKAKTFQRSHPSLSENEVLSVVTYTLDYPKVYDMFNFLTKTRGIKSDAYIYKGMHFFLSSAVHKLQVNMPQSTFRCERSPQAQALAIGNFFSFQQFASTTTDYYRALQFGEFCFHIITLRGAPIYSISSFPAEKEILVPSCETFQVVPLEEGHRFYAKLKSTGRSPNQANGTDSKNKLSASLFLLYFLFPVLLTIMVDIKFYI